MRRQLLFWVLFLVLVLVLVAMPIRARGETTEEFRTEDIQKYLDSLEINADRNSEKRTFAELMDELMEGNLADILKQGITYSINGVWSEVRANRALMGQIFVLAVVGAAFSGFSGIFGSGHVTETGFYVIYLLIMTFLTSSFFSSVNIAGRVTGELAEFMRALLPAYFLAVTAAGGALTSAAVCGFTFGAIGIVQVVLADF